MNGTDGMLGELIMALADLQNLPPPRTSPPRSPWRVCWARTACSSPSCTSRCAPTRPADAAANMLKVLEAPDRGLPTAWATTVCRTPTRAAPPGGGRQRDTAAYALTVAQELAGRVQPRGPGRRHRELQRQLPRRARGLRARLHGHPIADLASMSERRTDTGRRTWPAPIGLPPFLAEDPARTPG
ncbi:hypothetical protein QJS66_13800 [Kocuria rhizophila]|nr:hypothetical protein QJS66_13800 [Kocuria rhizophila]